jgi:Winged helix DNA-binding domain
MQRLEPADTIQLLPLFDAYTLGLGRDVEPLLPQTYKRLVFRPQGWISAVVLVNGAIQGVWQHTTRRAQTSVQVQMDSFLEERQLGQLPHALVQERYKRHMVALFDLAAACGLLLGCHNLLVSFSTVSAHGWSRSGAATGGVAAGRLRRRLSAWLDRSFYT